MPPDVSTELARAPFAEQLAWVDAAVARGTDAPGLLHAVAVLRDHEPLAHAVRALAARGVLAEPAVADALRAVLVALPDTGVHRVLRGLDRDVLAPASHDAVVDAVAWALAQLPVERIAAVCLLDRWLKNAAPARHRALGEAAVARCMHALDAGTLDALPDALLVRVAGADARALATHAAARGATEALRARRVRFAERVLDVLEAAPKSLSQANAEELLGHRVYTDPAHFLVELLQNADDAGATRWSVAVEPRAVTVQHDGVPFDARDVVGVLSIGQTTKHKGQIGFFGVGFKSVYEIAERPRVYSGAFAFEIADVSIPRRLAPWPGDAAADPDDTRLVLPLRDPGHADRGAEAIYARALALPPETLLTLARVRELSVARGAQRRTTSARPAAAPGRVELVLHETGEVRQYLVEQGRFAREGTREAGRASETPVLVALALGDDGAPRPLPDDAPTVFSYLPTGERSGLRFLLHAHFDVPVDRERVDLQSPWNRWAVGCAGELLARVVTRLADEAVAAAEDPAALARLDALLHVLPLRAELAHPAFASVVDALAARAAHAPCLRGAADTPVAPARASVVDDPALARVLASVPLDAAGRRALAPLPARSAAVARVLGAAPFDAADLLALLERELGARLDGDAPPAFLAGEGAGVVLAALAPSATGAARARVASLPVLPDARGRLYRAAAIARCDAELRALFGATRPLLAPALDATPTHAQVRTLEALAPARLGAADLARDLADPARAAAIVAGCGAAALLAYLARQPRELTAPLASAALFPDEHGALRPVVGPGAAWLAPRGPLRDFLGAMRGARVPLLDADVAAAFGGFLAALGATPLEVPALLAAIARGDVALAPADVPALHRALDALRDDLSPRACDQLARAAVFPDRAGRLRPLRGPDAALWPADAAVTAFAPDAPWLAPDVASLAYLRALGVAAVGADAVAHALAGTAGDIPLAIAPGDAAAMRAAYGYLAARARDVSPAALAALSEAPAWLDADGTARPLAALSLRPDEPVLRAFARAWGAWAEIDDDTARAGASAAALARALGLDRRLVAPDHGTLVDVLVAAPPRDLGDPALRVLLITALRECTTRLPRARLARLADAPLFRGDDGAPRALGRWDDPPQARVYRAVQSLREALALGVRPLLADADERDLGDVLDALGVRRATVSDLVRALEHDGLLATPEGAARARRALIAQRGELAQAYPAEPRAGRARLEALPLWPARDGVLRPASAVSRAADLRRAFGDAWDAERDDATAASALLEPHAEDDAEALRAWFAFRAPAEYVAQRVHREARAGELLDAQPAWLRSVERVAALVRVVGPDAARSLPLAVDAAGRLATPPRLAADADAIALLAGLPLHDDLADPTWAALAAGVDASLAPLLLPRRVVAAVAETAREAMAVDAHPLLGDASRRARWYAWLQAHASEIAADEQAWGALGRACVVPTRGGHLRAPRDLLLEPDLPDLGIDWNAADEVPAALQTWFRRVYRLDDKGLVPLVEYLLQGYEAAVSAHDRPRADEILSFLARSLRDAEQLAALPGRLKIHRRLLAESDAGAWLRPRELISPSAARGALIAAICAAPPPRLAPRYAADAGVLGVLRAAGVRTELSLEELQALLDGRGLRAGADALVALARYTAARALEQPALRDTLALDRRRWVPSATGKPSQPAELFWPTPDVVALLGERPELYPHPELVLTVPAAFGTWLAFRRAADAALADVALRITDGTAAPAAVLDWLAQALAAGRVAPGELQRTLGGVRFIADDEGGCRAPRELVCADASELFGRRRGAWRDGARRFAQLAAALGVPAAATPRDVSAHLEHVARDVAARGAGALLAAEPELLATLPAALAYLAARRAPPARAIAVLADDCERGASVCAAADPALYVPVPAELADAARDHQARVMLATLPRDGAAAIAVVAYLQRCGVASLADAWRPDLATPPADDVTASHRAAAHALARAIEALWRLLPRVAQRAPEVVSWRYERVSPRFDVRVFATLELRGDLGGAPVVRAVPCAADAERGRLWTTPDALGTLDDIARELCRRAIAVGTPDPALTDLVRQLLRAETVDAMTAVLDARAVAPAPATPAARAARAVRVPTAEATPPPPVAPESRGLFDQLRRWLTAGPAPDAPPRPQPASAPERDVPVSLTTAQQRQWFRPRDGVDAQLRDARDWLADRERAPRFGLAFAPRVLPAPFGYGPAVIAGRFDARTQRWLATDTPADWLAPAGAPGRRVAFRGELPAGQATLPVPLFATVADVEAGPAARVLTGRDGRTLVVVPADTEVSYTVALHALPAVTAAAITDESTRELLERTAPDDELPGEAHALLAALAADAPLARALAVRDFVRERYVYDPTYLEDPGVARWLNTVSRGRANAHLAALHAGRDARHLGRGVCYELNALVVELLRRAGVPAAVCTGWTFDRGTVSEPDHLWAMALLPTADGPRWWPFDASTTRDGRPLHVERRPPGAWRAQAPRQQGGAMPKVPEWAEASAPPGRTASTPRDTRDGPRGTRSSLRRAEGSSDAIGAASSAPAAELSRVVRYVEALTGVPVTSDDDLRARCESLLADPDAARDLLALFEDPREE